MNELRKKAEARIRGLMILMRSPDASDYDRKALGAEIAAREGIYIELGILSWDDIDDIEENVRAEIVAKALAE